MVVRVKVGRLPANTEIVTGHLARLEAPGGAPCPLVRTPIPPICHSRTQKHEANYDWGCRTGRVAR